MPTNFFPSPYLSPAPTIPSPWQPPVWGSFPFLELQWRSSRSKADEGPSDKMAQEARAAAGRRPPLCRVISRRVHPLLRLARGWDVPVTFSPCGEGCRTAFQGPGAPAVSFPESASCGDRPAASIAVCSGPADRRFRSSQARSLQGARAGPRRGARVCRRGRPCSAASPVTAGFGLRLENREGATLLFWPRSRRECRRRSPEPPFG